MVEINALLKLLEVRHNKQKNGWFSKNKQYFFCPTKKIIMR